MTLKLKALGLALVAVLAINALAASSASASRSGFTSEAAGTILKGHQDGTTGSATGTQTFDRGSSISAFDCTAVTLEGTLVGISVSTITLTANYPTGDCHGDFASNIHNDLATDECAYVFTNTAPGTVTTSIECNKAGGAIKVTPTAFGSSVCTITVPPQTLSGHIKLNNIDFGDITAESHVSGIDSTRHGSALCGSHEETDGTYTGNVIITGFKHSGAEINIALS